MQAKTLRMNRENCAHKPMQDQDLQQKAGLACRIVEGMMQAKARLSRHGRLIRYGRTYHTTR